jgi:hypothetical protein
MSQKELENTNDEVVSEELTSETPTPSKDYSALTIDELMTEVNELIKSEDVFSNAKTIDIIKICFSTKK